MKVDLSLLTIAVRNVPDFVLPEMDEGTRYLYDTVYQTLAQGEELRLSDINFDAFELHDIGSLDDLYNGVLGKNGYSANNITSTLRQVEPVSRVAAYV